MKYFVVVREVTRNREQWLKAWTTHLLGDTLFGNRRTRAGAEADCESWIFRSRTGPRSPSRHAITFVRQPDRGISARNEGWKVDLRSTGAETATGVPSHRTP